MQVAVAPAQSDEGADDGEDDHHREQREHDPVERRIDHPQAERQGEDEECRQERAEDDRPHCPVNRDESRGSHPSSGEDELAEECSSEEQCCGGVARDERVGRH